MAESDAYPRKPVSVSVAVMGSREIVFVTCDDGTVFRTDSDDFITWVEVSPPIPGSLTGVPTP